MIRMLPGLAGRWKKLKPVCRTFLGRTALVLLLVWPLGMLFAGGAWRVPLTPRMAFSAVFDGDHYRHVRLDGAALSNSLRRAVVAYQDEGFCGHMGFHRFAPRQVWGDFWTGRTLRDETGSPWYEINRTISRRAVRSILLWGGPGDPLRAVLEVWYTMLMEMAWSKDRILNAYLNTAEWAPGVYGAGAASLHYYGMPLDTLDRAQAARLACLLALREDGIALGSPDEVPGHLVLEVQEGMKSVRIRHNRICPR